MQHSLAPLPGGARWEPVDLVCTDCGADLRDKPTHCEHLPPAYVVVKDALPPDAYLVYSGATLHTGMGEPEHEAENVETVRLKVKFRPLRGRLLYEKWVLVDADPATARVVLSEALPGGLPSADDLWDIVDYLAPVVMEKRQVGEIR